jgi:hypothetical protein
MANGNDDCTSLDQGGIRFYDNYVPTLKVGDYLINVTQEVNPTNTTPAIDDAYASSQFFSVQGPRYTLPTSDLFSVFPPPNSQGVFDQYLPNVVLNQPELPWERNIFSDAAAQQTPWLALLLFISGEQIDGQSTLLAPQDGNSSATMITTIPAADLYANNTGDGILWPNIQAEWYESQDYLQQTLCTVIDISPQAFAALIPSRSDLQYLAHVRQVDPSSKDSEVLSINGDGWYSVVVGNRLPDAPPSANEPGQLNIVHLVSLEGFEDYIAGSAAIPAGITRVRMISFKGWTFTCLPELGASFKELANGLLTDQKGNAKSTSFILPSNQPGDSTAETAYAYQVIQNGYVPLSYQTRQGEQTFAWYRGPFSPIPVQNFISTMQQTAEDPSGWQPFARASDAIIYDKNYGIFDVSYGVAWETGRLLALSNSYFGQQLLDWERKGHNLIDLILERQTQLPSSAQIDPDNPDATMEQALLDQIDSYAVTGDFMTYLVTQFSSEIAPQFAGQPPASQPPFPPYATLPSPVPSPQTLEDLLTESDVQNLVLEQGGQELESITNWLAQLYLLNGVPFENLVPNQDMLPKESVRFFYVDSNWLDAMIEGALSIGIESSRDQMYQDLMKELIWNTTFSAAQQVRNNLLGTWAQQTPPGSSTPFDQGALSGMLLRSALVSGFPGLEIDAYMQTVSNNSPNPDLTTQIPLLRMERLSSDVMLCLWPAVPAVVTIGEPHEGVTFGFEDPPTGEGYYLYLRSVDPSNYGPQMSGSQYEINAESGFINSNRVIAITAGGGLVSTISSLLPSTPTINVRDFAMEMTKVPEQIVLAAQSHAPPPPSD